MFKRKNIVLIGFMGAGKTQIAKKLAQVLKRKVFSTDRLIELKEGKSILQIFKQSGEPYFRQLEKAVVREVSREKNVIIDCGGGAVIDPENLKRLKKNGLLIYLAASPKVLYHRVRRQKHRPLLKGSSLSLKKSIADLLNVRRRFYVQANFTIETSQKSLLQVFQEVINILNHSAEGGNRV